VRDDRGWGRLWRSRAARRWVEESVDIELRHHIEMRADELEEQGMSRHDALRLAEEAFGSRRRYRDECLTLQRREERMTRWLDAWEGWARDVAHGARTLRRNPGFTATLLLTLGLGVGATTAIFTVVDAVLVRPLPYADADRLYEVAPMDEESGFRLPEMYKPSALAWRARADFFEAVGLRSRVSKVWSDRGEARLLSIHLVDPELMEMLDVPPLVGRAIGPSDARPGAEKVVLLAEERWSADFGGDPSVVGSTMTLDGEPYTVIGVMPRAFRFPIAATRDLWAPLGADAMAELDERSWVGVVARLPLGVEAATVADRAESLQTALVEDGTELSGFPAIRLSHLDEWRANRDTERALWVIMGGSLIILLVAGFNAANLLLARSATRASEIAMRLALGGSRWRVVRQLSVEAALISGAAATLAVAVSSATLGSILAIAPSEIARWSPTPVELSGRVAAFTLGVAVIVTLAFAVLPLASVVRSSARPDAMRSTEGRAARRWRSALVIGEIGLSVVLMIGAGAFIRSFAHLVHVDPGFEAEGLVVTTPGLLETRYPTPEERRAYFETARDRLAGLPGVASVTLSSGTPPLSGVLFGEAVMAEGASPPPDQPDVFPFASVEPSFFDTYGLRFVAGRRFGPEDVPEARSRIIDLAMARWLFGEDAPIGRRFRMGDDGDWQTVVGVVEDIRLNGFDDAGQPYEILRPLPAEDGSAYLSLTVRTSGDAAALVTPIRDALHEIDAGQPIDRVGILADEMVTALDNERFLIRLMPLFAALALGLAGLGTFGVISFLVRRRQREIGIRLALGAAGGDVRVMVVRHAVALTLTGVLLGTGAAFGLGSYVDQLLTGVSVTDPIVVTVTALTALAASVAASAIPARWATRVDPARVLSAE